jgi:hypothetical protein
MLVMDWPEYFSFQGEQRYVANSARFLTCSWMVWSYMGASCISLHVRKHARPLSEVRTTAPSAGYQATIEINAYYNRSGFPGVCRLNTGASSLGDRAFLLFILVIYLWRVPFFVVRSLYKFPSRLFLWGFQVLEFPHDKLKFLNF